MYTGIVATTGTVTELTPTDGGGCHLRVESPSLADVDPGDSVAVAGVCLTAEETGDDWLTAALSSETVARTFLADLDLGAAVNLERPVRADDRLDGHVVKGTVDCVGTVRALEADGEGRRLAVDVPAAFDRYIAPKGAVAVDGASLTVAERDADGFTVALVPETAERTTLAAKTPGDPVHLEADPLARYAERLMGARAPL